MNEQVGLRVLSEIMHWSDERARREFDWLRLMARLRYDGYRDFLAGVRFIESLATWLQQFDSAEREVAYKFVETASFTLVRLRCRDWWNSSIRGRCKVVYLRSCRRS